MINFRISKFEVVWINCYLTIVITYKTYWHNDISAVKTLFSQHLFTCNLCKIVWKYDLFGRHVKNLCCGYHFYSLHITYHRLYDPRLAPSKVLVCRCKSFHPFNPQFSKVMDIQNRDSTLPPAWKNSHHNRAIHMVFYFWIYIT